MTLDQRSHHTNQKATSRNQRSPDTTGHLNSEETSKMLEWWKKDYQLNEKDRLWKELRRSRSIPEI